MVSLLYETFSFLSWSCINATLTTQIFVLSLSYDTCKSFMKDLKIRFLLQVWNMKQLSYIFLSCGWLMVSKISWEIRWILTGPLKNINIFSLMGYFYPKYALLELKFTEELCVMAAKNDAKFEKENWLMVWKII